MLSTKRIAIIILLAAVLAEETNPLPAQENATAQTSSIAVAPQYDTTHVYVTPADVDAFVTSFLGTFGGTTTKQVSVTVTPTPSTTTSQLLQTPVGTVSLFGFATPIPFPFGSERTGYLVSDMAAAIKTARDSGADVVVSPFPDPIGVDAIIQWPGGVMTQLYWHTSKPSYARFAQIPENRVYVSADRADAFLKSFLAFSNGHITRDDHEASGVAVGFSTGKIREIQAESSFGRLHVFVTNGHLPYPYGRETTGYEVKDLGAALAKASTLGVKILVAPIPLADRISAMALFPGGYVAEIHAPKQ